jgi:hypothetical protein
MFALVDQNGDVDLSTLEFRVYDGDNLIGTFGSWDEALDEAEKVLDAKAPKPKI